MAFWKKKDKQDVKKETGKKPVKADSGAIKDDKKKPEEKKQSMKDLYGSGQTAASTKKQSKKEGKKAKREYGNAHRVLVKPLITEKATNLGAENKYVFEVARDANKIEIARAVNEVYGVMPTGVNIIKARGKSVRYGRTIGKRKEWKKAIVTLPAGKSINIYEGV